MKPPSPKLGMLVRRTRRGRNRWRGGNVIAVGESEFVVRWYEHGVRWEGDEFVVMHLGDFARSFEVVA